MDVKAEYAELPDQALVVGGLIALLMLLGLGVAIIFLIRHLRSDALPWRERMKFLSDIPISSTPLLVLVAVLMFMYTLSAAATIFYGSLAAGEIGFVIQSIAFHWMIIAFIVVWKLRSDVSWRQLFGFGRKGFTYQASRGVLAYLMSFPVIIVSGFLYQLILIHLGYEPTQQPIMNFLAGDLSAWVRIYGLVLAVLIAPFAEEFLFRGLLLPVLARRLGAVSAAIAVSLIFAGMHLFIPALVPLFFVSLACSFAYIYTGSLTTAIVFHSIFNTVNLALFSMLHGLTA